MFSDSAFDLVSIVYGIGALWTVITLVRRGRRFWHGQHDPQGAKLAFQAAFFLFIPFAVFLHELGHALATWTAGGEVVRFGWRVYWGFVISEGRFTAAQDWWIALSGNLVSVMLGLGFLAAGFLGKRLLPSVRYLLLQAGVIQLVFALVAYPLITFAGLEGDWKTIYDFSTTPVLSTLVAVAHVGSILGLSFLIRRKLDPLTHRLGRQAWGDTPPETIRSVDISYRPIEPEAGDEVWFRVVMTRADGSVKTDQFRHRYDAPGTYTVSVGLGPGEAGADEDPLASVTVTVRDPLEGHEAPASKAPG